MKKIILLSIIVLTIIIIFSACKEEECDSIDPEVYGLWYECSSDGGTILIDSYDDPDSRGIEIEYGMDVWSCMIWWTDTGWYEGNFLINTNYYDTWGYEYAGMLLKACDGDWETTYYEGTYNKYWTSYGLVMYWHNDTNGDHGYFLRFAAPGGDNNPSTGKLSP